MSTYENQQLVRECEHNRLSHTHPGQKEQLYYATKEMNAYTNYFTACKKTQAMNADIAFESSIQHAMTMHWPSPRFLYAAPPTGVPSLSFAPADLTQFAELLGEAYGMNSWEVLLGVLGCVSIASRGCFRVQVESNWVEPVSLYMVFAKASGSKKSSYLQKLSEPIQNYQLVLQSKFNSFLAQTEEKVITSLERTKQKEIVCSLKKCLDNGDKLDTLREHMGNEVEKLQKIRSIASSPTSLPVLLTENFTLSALEQELQKQGGVMGICTAEDPFSKLNLLAKNSGVPSLLLKSYNMEPYSRPITNRRPITLDRPSISMVVAMQPEILLQYYECSHLINCGFLHRLTPCFMQNRERGMTQQVQLNDKDYAYNLYHEKITSMLNRTYSRNCARPSNTLHLSDDAHEQILQYKTYLDGLLFVQGNYSFRQRANGCIRKHHGLAVRLAACLHLWRHDNPVKYDICGDDMCTAIMLSNVLVQHACYAYDTESRENMNNAKRILYWVYRHMHNRFTITEVSQGCNKLPKGKAEPAVTLLEAYGWLRCIRHPGKATVYVMNPYYYSQYNYLYNNIAM